MSERKKALIAIVALSLVFVCMMASLVGVGYILDPGADLFIELRELLRLLS
jgi:hypothetical protein